MDLYSRDAPVMTDPRMVPQCPKRRGALGRLPDIEEGASDRPPSCGRRIESLSKESREPLPFGMSAWERQAGVQNETLMQRLCRSRVVMPHEGAKTSNLFG